MHDKINKVIRNIVMKVYSLRTLKWLLFHDFISITKYTFKIWSALQMHIQ